MKKIIFYILILLPVASFAQQAEVVKFPFIESLINTSSDTTYVINFWASWCKPCVKEISEFEELNSKYSSKKVKVVLVSLDFKRDVETRVGSLIKQKQLKSQVVLLDDLDYNSWIDRVDKSWGGAIPATLFVNNFSKKRQFFEKEFTFEELEQTVKQLIN